VNGFRTSRASSSATFLEVHAESSYSFGGRLGTHQSATLRKKRGEATNPCEEAGACSLPAVTQVRQRGDVIMWGGGACALDGSKKASRLVRQRRRAQRPSRSNARAVSGLSNLRRCVLE